jgi:hypothetical protein
MPAASYFHDTRAPRYSLLLALPLLLLYEVMAAALATPQAGLRNGADVVLQALIAGAVGHQGTLYVTAAVIALCIAWVVRDTRRHGGIRPGWFPLMLLESAALAVVFAIVVATATSQLLAGLGAALMVVDAGQGAPLQAAGPATAVMLSLGAGLYEELLFRVLLVTGLAAGARALLGLSAVTAGVIACVVSALLFSAFHYVGAYGDPFTLQSFTFRAVAGLAFSGLYLLRGFGITAWTHALYDIGVLLLL